MLDLLVALFYLFNTPSHTASTPSKTYTYNQTISPTPAPKKYALRTEPTPTPSPAPTSTPTPTPTSVSMFSFTPSIPPFPTPTPTSAPKTDTSSGNATTSNGATSDILQALNTYRQQHGVGPLTYDGTLTSLAQGRANQFNAAGGLDGHAGFESSIGTTENMQRLGYSGMGENSSFGNDTNGTSLIDQTFGQHAPHNGIQLDPNWNRVGIGVSGSSVDIIFATK